MCTLDFLGALKDLLYGIVDKALRQFWGNLISLSLSFSSVQVTIDDLRGFEGFTKHIYL